jgi:response regulator RpfG family c-di-GMP phosphodiesterase
MPRFSFDSSLSADERWGLMAGFVSTAPAGLSRTELIVRITERLRGFDPDTFTHTASVTRLTGSFIEFAGVPAEYASIIVDAAWIHDISKVAIRLDVLNRPGPMTREEWIEMRLHPARAAKLLESHPILKDLAPIVRHHHEHFDGRGYPDGISGNEIPVGSRIIAVADAFDAMTSNRPYRPRMTFDAAFAELGRCAGSQFDPVIVEQFVELSGSI